MKDLIEYVARALVDNPDAVEVTEVPARSSTILELRVAPDDMGRVIGKSGRGERIRALLRVPPPATTGG
jgi:predicted RNA-binding protein YlqC (UPF0109 family)